MTVAESPELIVNAGNVFNCVAAPVRYMWSVLPLSTWGSSPSFLKFTVKLTDELGHIVVGPTRFTDPAACIEISLSNWENKLETEVKINIKYNNIILELE